jgi:hypothetical protein
MLHTTEKILVADRLLFKEASNVDMCVTIKFVWDTFPVADDIKWIAISSSVDTILIHPVLAPSEKVAVVHHTKIRHSPHPIKYGVEFPSTSSYKCKKSEEFDFQCHKMQ